MADNQNSIRNRSNHKGARDARFVLISEPEAGDQLAILVANFEVGETAFAEAGLDWAQSVSHLLTYRAV